MPLSAPVERDHKYTRRIECHGYRRTDGLWDIEGHLQDLRSEPSETPLGRAVEAGATVHGMAMRLTIDEAMTIHAVEASMVFTPYPVCPGVTQNLQRLVGASLQVGFTKTVRERLGGREGCAHLREMLVPMATTAFQSIFVDRRQRLGKGDEPGAGAKLADSCFAFARDGDIVKRRWPEVYAAR